MTPRFYVPGIRETGQVVLLAGEEYHHLRKVLRLGVGDRISLFDGQGRGFQGEIAGLSRSQAKIVLGAEEPQERESGLRLVLVAALSKGEKFEWVVQKATELGVSEIRPVYTERADVRPVPGREERKAGRWRRVALEACKQSGRTRIPLVEEPRRLREILPDLGPEVRIVLDPGGGEEAGEAIRKAAAAREVAVAVGPEGGWTPGEIEHLREAGFLPLRLGPRILRTETAAIVSAALLQFLAGDLGTRAREGGPPPGR